MVLFGSLRDPEYFCFCYDLKKGCILIGFLYVFVFFFLCAQLLWHPCYTNILSPSCRASVYIGWPMICVINIFNILGCLTAIGFLFGIFCEIRQFVTNFLYILCISGMFVPLVFNAAVIYLSCYYSSTYPSCFFAPNLGNCMIMSVAFVTITAYCITVIKSYRAGMNFTLSSHAGKEGKTTQRRCADLS